MFEKFIRNKNCLEVLLWLLNHSDGEYSAAVIAIECGVPDVNTFMAVLSVLEGVNLVKVNQFEEELNLRLNNEENITQLFKHFKDEFNDKAFRSETVSPALAYLTSNGIKNIIDEKMFENYDVKEVFEMFKNYKDLDLDVPVHKEIYDICSRLEESGDYDKFIDELEETMKK